MVGCVVADEGGTVDGQKTTRKGWGGGVSEHQALRLAGLEGTRSRWGVRMNAVGRSVDGTTSGNRIEGREIVDLYSVIGRRDGFDGAIRHGNGNGERRQVGIEGDGRCGGITGTGTVYIAVGMQLFLVRGRGAGAMDYLVT